MHYKDQGACNVFIYKKATVPPMQNIVTLFVLFWKVAAAWICSIKHKLATLRASFSTRNRFRFQNFHNSLYRNYTP